MNSFIQDYFNSQQTPLLHSHREKEKDRRVSEKVVASRIGESRLSDADTYLFKQIEICPYLRQEQKHYPPYCTSKNSCDDMFIFAGDKYCKRELLYFNKK